MKPGCRLFASVELPVFRIVEQLRDRRFPRRDHLGRRALRACQSAKLAHREIDALFPDGLEVGKLRQPLVADDRQQAKLAGIELRPDLLQLADAHVEGVVQHVDEHVAAALEGGDRRSDAGLLLQLLHHLPFERRRIGGAPLAAAVRA